MNEGCINILTQAIEEMGVDVLVPPVMAGTYATALVRIGGKEMTVKYGGVAYKVEKPEQNIDSAKYNILRRAKEYGVLDALGH